MSESVETTSELVGKADMFLVQQQLAMIEEFTMSGAMPRDLCIECGPIDVKTIQTLDGGAICYVQQALRMV